MSIITLSTARAHLRLEDDYPAEQLQGKLNAAEDHAAQFLNRRLFADDSALDEAVTAVPTELVAARAAYDSAMEAADSIEDAELQALARGRAEITYTRAKALAQETYHGLVMNASVEAAVLLILGHLYANRQDVVLGAVNALPHGSIQLLVPYRVGMGV